MLHRSDLKIRLVLSMVLLSTLCFALSSGYVVLATGQRAHAHASWMAEMVAKDLQSQLQRASWVARPSIMRPDLEMAAASVAAPGGCIAFRDGSGVRQRFCDGVERLGSAPPGIFVTLYRLVLNPDRASAHDVLSDGHKIGEIAVQFDAPTVIGQAWRDTSRIISILAITLLALCGLLCVAFHRILGPMSVIRAGLERLAVNDLSARLPSFELGELSAISTVFNQLAGSLEAAVSQRDTLLRQLLTLQEDERRDLARDLHDEFGQCLAAIGARAASIRQIAAPKCPELLEDCNSVTNIVQQMMLMLRGVLTRLRPPDLDECGLCASLRNLVAGWNASGTTRFSIELDGEPDCLPSPTSTALYRVAQEAMTNAAKHARATMVSLRLTTRCGPDILLSVEDDGITGDGDIATGGLGILGIRERVSALGGVMSLRAREPRGLVLSVVLPMPKTAYLPAMTEAVL